MIARAARFERLFSPIRIGSLELRNRIVMSPMTTDYASDDQLPSPRLHAYLEERARDAPDPDRVGDVTEVQITGGTGSEAGERRCWQPAAQCGQIERRHGAKDHLASGLARPGARSYLSLTRPRPERGRRTMTHPAAARRGTRSGPRREYGE